MHKNGISYCAKPQKPKGLSVRFRLVYMKETTIKYSSVFRRRYNAFEYLLLGSYIVASCGLVGAYTYNIMTLLHPNPPVYRDVNGDGIDDKIIQKKVYKRMFLISIPTLEEECLYGVDINGKKIYLPKKEFDELR